MAPEESSPLLRLAPELRNRIYDHLLVPAKHEVFHLEHGHMHPPILCANRQLRRECTGFFFANNTLQFTDPEVCIRRLTTMAPEHVDLIPELRYDTSETCIKVTSWRSAFRELPGLDEDTKLDNVREELAKRGITLRVGVLKAKIVVSCRTIWTSDPLAAALNAVKQGEMVGRMMFV